MKESRLEGDGGKIVREDRRDNWKCMEREDVEGKKRYVLKR